MNSASARLFVIAIAATLLAALLLMSGALWPLDGRLYDIGVTSRTLQAPANIAVVGIDEAFMQGRHAYMAPRDRLAGLITAIGAARPRAVVVDVWLDSRIDARGDAQLRAALLRARRSGVPVFLADVPLTGRNNRNGATAHGSVLPYFAGAAAGTGSVLFRPDSDGVVRCLPGTDDAADMAPLALLAAQRAGAGALRREPTPLLWDARTLPLTSAATLLAQPYLAALLTGKIVFIGAAYARSYDTLETPFSMQPGSPPTYGVQVLAAATDTLMRGSRRRSYEGLGASLDVLLLTFAISLVVALFACRGAGPGLICLLFVVVGALLLAFVSARNIVAPPPHFYQASPLVVGAVAACGLGVAWRQWQQAGELRLVRDAFGAYVGAEVLAKMGGKMPELGGELRTIAVLFCDIRGYSALAESMRGDPAGLMSELNAHFEPLIGALKQHGAYADNYVGDLVMALFGAPLSQGSVRADAEASVLAALDFVRLVDARNALRATAGQAPIEVGIGLHCGEAVVGNLGTLGPQSKIHYTAIGDAVNIASRVESTTRKYDVPLLVTEEIVQACGEAFEWEFVDETTVKGRVAPVRLYRPAAVAHLRPAHREVP